MKHYYIYLGDGQKGPFTFEEAIKQVKADTLIWHEGMPDWQRADAIEEFKNHFRSVPPPVRSEVLNQIPPTPITISDDDEYEAPRIFGIKRKLIVYILLGIGLFIGIVAFTNYRTEQGIRSYEIERQFLEQQRIATEKRIKELNIELIQAYKNLEHAKRNIHDTSAFQLLRSSSERHQEMTKAENLLKACEKRIYELESEMRGINPGWKKL